VLLIVDGDNKGHTVFTDDFDGSTGVSEVANPVVVNMRVLDGLVMVSQ